LNWKNIPIRDSLDSMADVIITGASRGIGRALALRLAGGTDRLVLVARDGPALDARVADVASRGGSAVARSGDLSTLAGARALGDELARLVEPGATLVHNAGLWPSRRVLTTDGLEAAFATNCLAPLALQAPLLAAGRLRRILLVGAGAMVLGRFDRARTPTGEDFSGLRTYCTTKLAGAVAMRQVAAAHRDVDVLVVHPGVVRTGLGTRSGPLGWLVALAKHFFERPERCADRLARILARERWSPPGEARWQFEEREQPWPPVTASAETQAAVGETVDRLLSLERAEARARLRR
jgi:NAD(P)-dependent dehydrogenase (short-subunit alcohol dehydrogenase family)